MSFEYINKTYGLNVRRGTRVRYSGYSTPRDGTVTGASGSHLRIRLDGDYNADPYHPTWKLEVLESSADSPVKMEKSK